MPSVIFIYKDDKWANMAKGLLEDERSFQVTSFLSGWGAPIPEELRKMGADYIVSYLSRWVLPASVLCKAKVAAINIHPAPPEYPGVGGINFALYNGDKTFGATCHHMAPKVDSGEIIDVRRFPISDGASVSSVQQQTYSQMFSMFCSVFGYMLSGTPLPSLSSEKWGSRTYMKRDLDKLYEIDITASKEEVDRKVRATSFGSWQPRVYLHGRRFDLHSDLQSH